MPKNLFIVKATVMACALFYRASCEDVVFVKRKAESLSRWTETRRMTGIYGRTILVTIGAGLIGSHAVARLKNEGRKGVKVFDKVINKRNLGRKILNKATFLVYTALDSSET